MNASEKRVKRNQRHALRREKINATSYKWDAANLDKVKAAQVRYRTKNRQKRIEAHRKWYAENQEIGRAASRRWHTEHPDHSKELLRKWKAGNPEKVLLYCARRHERLKSQGGTVRTGFIKHLKAMQKNRCAFCQQQLSKLNVDHIVPLVRGGVHDESNLQLLCPTCNRRKHALMPHEFAQRMGRLL